MKSKAGWLVVIFISSVQLALLLIAVMMTFSWFLSTTVETATVETAQIQDHNDGALESNNHTAASQIAESDVMKSQAAVSIFNEAQHRIRNRIETARQVVFGATLFISLACLCLIASILKRIAAHVDDSNQGLVAKVSKRERDLVKSQSAMIFGLAKLAESRDNDTGDHLDRIRSYVMILCKGLADRFPEIDSTFMNNVALASSLHDIGKVGIPDSILLKPGRLNDDEREIMKLHTRIGGQCLEAIQSHLDGNEFMAIAKQVAYYHHEHWDGNGYPFGLENDKIPLVARIVAVADVYDALTSKRPYKKPFSHSESRAVIVSGSGAQFDPEIVNAFMRFENEFETISRAQQVLTDADVTSEFFELCDRAQASSSAN